MKTLLGFMLFWLTPFVPLNGQTVQLTLTNIRNGAGQLCIAAFDSEAGFRKEEPVWKKHIAKSSEMRDSLELIIVLPEGWYGISVLNDVDGDGRMSFRFPGIPAEGFGFSDYHHRGLKRPQWEQFAFEIKSGQVTKVFIVMQYF